MDDKYSLACSVNDSHRKKHNVRLERNVKTDSCILKAWAFQSVSAPYNLSLPASLDLKIKGNL